MSAGLESNGFEIDPAKAAAIIDDRTSVLARDAREGARDRIDVLRVATSGETYAIPLGALMAAVRPRPLGALALARSEIEGTLYERGEIWTVYSLRALLGGAGERAAAGALLLLRRDRRRAALSVDRLEGIDKPSRATFSAASAAPSMIEGATPEGVMLINVEALWRHPALTQRKSA